MSGQQWWISSSSHDFRTHFYIFCLACPVILLDEYWKSLSFTSLQEYFPKGSCLPLDCGVLECSSLCFSMVEIPKGGWFNLLPSLPAGSQRLLPFLLVSSLACNSFQGLCLVSSFRSLNKTAAINLSDNNENI